MSGRKRRSWTGSGITISGRWAKREQALREMITGVFAMASELAAAGAELPPLRAELPAPPNRVLAPAT